jgi:methylenetetrahydrofolate dehydrogenase (NADP+)/methenyltetrahydrofolate cyclohydrolase
MISNGRHIASEILQGVHASLGGRRPVVRAIVVQPSPATESYLKIKESRANIAGMDLEVIRMEDDASEADSIEKITLPGADAVIVQLPLPATLNTENVVGAIPTEKDADVLSSAAYENFERNDAGALIPPVAGAVAEILSRANVEVAGKRAVVVGQGKLVGRPVLTLLRRLGADAIAVLEDTPHPETIFREADIIVSGAGKAGLITPDMVKEGVVLIDAGTSEANGVIVGDMDPACAEKASVFTPVPGGVGPVAVAMLFKNVARLLK